MRPFQVRGGNGCQTDAGFGLVLMGHRYYDTRIGRFISQDPAGDGDNWYAYCDNSPVNGIDPDGLFMQMPPTGETMAHEAMMGFLGGLSDGESGMGDSFTVTNYTYTRTRSFVAAVGVIGEVGPWGPWELTGEDSTTYSFGDSGMGEGFMADGALPMQMAMPRWKQILQVGLAVVAGGLTIGKGVQTPTVPIELPQVVAEEGKKAKTTQEKEDDDGAGSKFFSQKPSLHNFITNITLAGHGLLNGLNNLGDAWQGGTHGSSGYGGLAPFGSSVESIFR